MIIGREPGDQTEEEQKIVFNDSPKISRQHLKIFWDEETQEWKAQSLSKNTDCAAIKFDKYCFYFFPAY